MTDHIFPTEYQAKIFNIARNLDVTDFWNWCRESGPPGDWRQGLTLIDIMLQGEMEAQEREPANERMAFKLQQPDLNKYRGWLLHKVMLQAGMQAQELSREVYRFPEDLPTVVEDLWTFHKLPSHRRQGMDLPLGADKWPDGNINAYRTLNDFNAAILPFTPAYPITAAELKAANAQCLNGRDAVLLHETADGGMLLHAKTKEAAIAYGSPRWCTARKDENNAFRYYSYNLLIAICPDGARYQFHFGDRQFMDGRDNAVELPVLAKQQPWLVAPLAPYIKVEAPSNRLGIEATMRDLKLAASYPEWQQAITFGLLGMLQMANKYGRVKLLEIYAAVPIWRKSIRKIFEDASSLAAVFVNSVEEDKDISRHKMLDFLIGVPEWHKAAAPYVRKLTRFDEPELMEKVCNVPGWENTHSAEEILNYAACYRTMVDTKKLERFALNFAPWQKDVQVMREAILLPADERPPECAWMNLHNDRSLENLRRALVVPRQPRRPRIAGVNPAANSPSAP